MLRNSLAISTIVEVKVLLDQIHLGLNLQKRIGVNGRPASRTHLVKTRKHIDVKPPSLRARLVQGKQHHQVL